METANIKSRACLSSFIKYCVTHPEERFWQALRNWSGYEAIMTGRAYTDAPGFEGHLDTFYWEGKRHDGE